MTQAPKQHSSPEYPLLYAVPDPIRIASPYDFADLDEVSLAPKGPLARARTHDKLNAEVAELAERVSEIAQNSDSLRAQDDTETMTEYRHELALRDEQLRREMDLRQEAFRSEQAVRDKALDDRLGRMEGSVSNATKEIKDFKLWMAGIGVAVVLAIVGANYTLVGSAQGIFDGGKASQETQQKVEKLLQDAQVQAEQNRQLLLSIQAKQSAPPPVEPSK